MALQPLDKLFDASVIGFAKTFYPELFNGVFALFDPYSFLPIG